MISDYLVNIQDALKNVQLEPAQRADPHTSDLQPGLNAMMRCPLPPVNITPDSTRQFYRGGMLPQIRVMSPPPNNATGGGISSSSEDTGSSGSSGSSGGGSTTVSLKLQQLALTTTPLNPNSIFIGSLQLGKVFDIMQISTSASARVRLYGNLRSQTLDAARQIDVPPAFGTEQGLIVDVALDTSPLTFSLEGISGSNYDNPPNNLVYTTVTNIGNTSSPITVTVSYVQLVP